MDDDTTLVEGIMFVNLPCGRRACLSSFGTGSSYLFSFDAARARRASRIHAATSITLLLLSCLCPGVPSSGPSYSYQRKTWLSVPPFRSSPSRRELHARKKRMSFFFVAHAFSLV